MVDRWMKASTSWTTEEKLNSLKIGSGRKAYYFITGYRAEKARTSCKSATIKVTMF